ncbi:MAG TPA: hypothetical protein DCM62_06300 [Bacteroidales bacterium]|nr:hypothetical protein [Bacteroidales bacterium]
MRNYFVVASAILLLFVVLVMTSLFYSWFSLEIADWAMFFFVVPFAFSLIKIFDRTKSYQLPLMLLLGAIVSTLLERDLDFTEVLKESIAAISGALMVCLFIFFTKKVKE